MSNSKKKTCQTSSQAQRQHRQLKSNKSQACCVTHAFGELLVGTWMHGSNLEAGSAWQVSQMHLICLCLHVKPLGKRKWKHHWVLKVIAQVTLLTLRAKDASISLLHDSFVLIKFAFWHRKSELLTKALTDSDKTCSDTQCGICADFLSSPNFKNKAHFLWFWFDGSQHVIITTTKNDKDILICSAKQQGFHAASMLEHHLNFGWHFWRNVKIWWQKWTNTTQFENESSFSRQATKVWVLWILSNDKHN